MYKLIIGNVRVTVADDKIPHDQAIQAAKQAIQEAAQQEKLLSLIEIEARPDGLAVEVTEKGPLRAAKKTLKQSMLDGIRAAAQERLFPNETFETFYGKDVWYDNDTGQEWRGAEVDTARSEIMAELDTWLKEHLKGH